MLNFSKMRLFAATMLVAAMFAACDKDKGGDGSGKGPSGSNSKVENGVLVGMDVSNVVPLPYAIYEQEESGYVFYFSTSPVDDVQAAEELLRTHADDVLAVYVTEPSGVSTEWKLLYDGTEYESTDTYATSSVSVKLGADDSLEMSVALTFDDSSENLWAAWKGTAVRAGYPAVNNAWAVGKNNPTPLVSAVETVLTSEGIRKYVLSDAEQTVLTFTVAESYFAAPETLAAVGGDVKFVLPEGVSDVVFLGESYPKAGADAYGVFKVTASGSEGTLGRTVTFIYEDLNSDEIVRVMWDGRVTVGYNATNTYSLNLGYEEETRTGEFNGNVYSYANGDKNYLLYSTVAGASTLNELKGNGEFAYTVLVALPNTAAPWTPATPGFAMSAYEYNVDKVNTEKSNWWDIFDDGVSSKTGTLAVSDADKSYLANKTLNLEGGTVYYTDDPSRATDYIYFGFNAALTPAYSPTVRPSYRKAEQFAAEYWGTVVKLEGDAGDPAKVLGNPSDDDFDGDLNDEGNYFRVLSPEGQVIFHRDIHQMYVNYDKRTENVSSAMTFVSQGLTFGLEIYLDNDDNKTSSSYTHNQSAQVPILRFANDLRPEEKWDQPFGWSNAIIPHANVVNVGPVTLDRSETLDPDWDNSKMPQLFELQYTKSLFYWGKNDTDDSKYTNQSALANNRLSSPYKDAPSYGNPTYYGTTEKGSITVDYDYDTDIWTIDFEVLDSYRTYTSDNVSTGGTLAGMNKTFVLHYKGSLIGQYTKLAQN